MTVEKESETKAKENEVKKDNNEFVSLAKEEIDALKAYAMGTLIVCIFISIVPCRTIHSIM